jgi:hypothetical protein
MVNIDAFHLISCRATKLPGASKIEKMDAAPGGGFRVVVADPAGFLINLIAGQELAHIGEVPQNLIYNYENKKVRQGAFQRFSEGPAAVHRVSINLSCRNDPRYLTAILTPCSSVILGCVS